MKTANLDLGTSNCSGLGSALKFRRNYLLLSEVFEINEVYLLFNASSAVQEKFINENLTISERSIHDGSLLEDKLIFALTKRLIDRDKKAKVLDKYIPVNLADYNMRQIPWLRDCKFYLSQKIGTSPNSLQVVESYENYGCPIQFKVWYILHYSDNIVKVWEN